MADRTLALSAIIWTMEDWVTMLTTSPPSPSEMTGKRRIPYLAPQEQQQQKEMVHNWFASRRGRDSLAEDEQRIEQRVACPQRHKRAPSRRLDHLENRTVSASERASERGKKKTKKNTHNKPR
jgi:hypothetical protein